ncbi:MAG: site-specific integrase [Candidatus Pacearchaeota archaeon]
MNKKELKKAFGEGLITEEQFKEELFKLETLKSEKRKAKKLPVALTEEEFYNLIKASKKKQHKFAFLLGFGAGLRIGEILTLKPEDFNLKERIILVHGKGNKDRMVPLPKGFKPEFLKLLPFTYKNYQSGARSLEISFKKAAIKSGLLQTKPNAHFHSLRHSFGTNASNKGIPIHHIRTLMGHTNISTTNVYLEMNPKEAIKSYEELF